jgi:hypothetical protein
MDEQDAAPASAFVPGYGSEPPRRPASAPPDAYPGVTTRGFARAAPKRRFPLHYVGVGLLTLVAYFAWLYLLDHL